MRKSMLCPPGTECHGVFLLRGVMEGWSLLLQESPCLMEGGTAEWREKEKMEVVRKSGKSGEEGIVGGMEDYWK